jgi:hypothetical protein
MQQLGNTDRFRQVIHKESSKEKNNKTKGQIDNLRKYGTRGNKSRDQLATDDKQIQREANYIKNIHIDETIQLLKSVGLVTEDNHHAWWAKVCHTLGSSFVRDQANLCLNRREVRNPQALFHFLINKEMNKHNDPYMPRFNK